MFIGLFVHDQYGQEFHGNPASTTECKGVIQAESLEEAARSLGARLFKETDFDGRLYIRLPGIKTYDWIEIYLEIVPSDPKDILRTCGRYRKSRRNRRAARSPW